MVSVTDLDYRPAARREKSISLNRCTPMVRSRGSLPPRPTWAAPIRFIGRAAPAALLFQNGRQDQLVSVEDAEALHAAAPEPKTIRWYDAGHGLTPDARAERWAWLAPHIGTTP